MNPPALLFGSGTEDIAVGTFDKHSELHENILSLVDNYSYV